MNEQLKEALLKLAGHAVNINCAPSSTSKIYVWVSELSYQGKGCWKAANYPEFKGCVTFQEEDVQEIRGDVITLKVGE